MILIKKGCKKLGKCATIIVRDGWALCPVCGGKLLKLNPDTSVSNLPCKCKRCSQISQVNIAAPEPVSKETSA